MSHPLWALRSTPETHPALVSNSARGHVVTVDAILAVSSISFAMAYTGGATLLDYVGRVPKVLCPGCVDKSTRTTTF